MEALNRYLVRALFLLLLCFPAMAVQAQQKDVPRRGEGITTFLQRHGRSPRKYYAAFIELNRDKLGRSPGASSGCLLCHSSVGECSGREAEVAPFVCQRAVVRQAF